MKLVQLLVFGMMAFAIHYVSVAVLQTDVSALIGSVNPDAGKAYSLVTENASNWTGISRTITGVLNR